MPLPPAVLTMLEMVAAKWGSALAADAAEAVVERVQTIRRRVADPSDPLGIEDGIVEIAERIDEATGWSGLPERASDFGLQLLTRFALRVYHGLRDEDACEAARAALPAPALPSDLQGAEGTVRARMRARRRRRMAEGRRLAPRRAVVIPGAFRMPDNEVGDALPVPDDALNPIAGDAGASEDPTTDQPTE